MLLPKTVEVGETTYTINQPKEIEGCLGQIDFTEKVIYVAKQARNCKLANEERSDTFWHELTHAILNDMNHPLTRNERFVTAFAHRLNEAILSAKF
jgi:hypothetical protein